MRVEDLVSYLDIEVRKTMSLEDALRLVDNVGLVKYILEEDGYVFGDHFDYDSIIRDILPEFLEDMKIVVDPGPGMYIDDEEWEKEMGR